MNKKKTKKIWIISGVTFGLLGTAAIIGFPTAYLLPNSNETNNNLTNLINQVTVTKTPLTFVPTNLINGASQNIPGVGLPPKNEFNVVLPTGLSRNDVTGYKILPSSNNSNVTTQMQIELTFSNNATKTFTLSNLPTYANVSLLFNTIAAKVKSGINSNSSQWNQLLELSNNGNTIANNVTNTTLFNSIFDFYFPEGFNMSFIESFNLVPSNSTNANYILVLSSYFYGNNNLSQNINISLNNNITQPANFTMALAEKANIAAPAVNNLITNFSSTLNTNPYSINDFVFTNLPSEITLNDMSGFTVLESNINTGIATINLYFNSQNTIFPFLNVKVQFDSIQEYISNSSNSINVNVLPTSSTSQIPNVTLPSVSPNEIDVPTSMNFSFTNYSILTASDIIKYIVTSVDATKGSIVATFILSNKNWSINNSKTLEVKNITVTGYIDSFQQELNSITVKANVNHSENILANTTKISGSNLNNYTFSFANSSGTISKLISSANITSFVVVSNDIINGNIIVNINVKDETSGIIYLISNVTITGFFKYSHYINNLSFYLINESNDFPTKIGQTIPINNVLYQPINNDNFFNNSNISSISVSSIDSTNKTLQVLVTFQFKINNQSTYTTVQYPDALTFNWNTLS